jgi:hypothetical protein
MEKLNKNFIADPAAFLQDHVIEYSQSLAAAEGELGGRVRTLARGIHDFDLTKDGASKGGGGVVLRPWSERGGRWNLFSHPIRAFWLPWRLGKTVSVDLGSDEARGALFFFTSQLDGCRFEIGPGTEPLVAHIPANTDGVTDPSQVVRQRDALTWRNAESARLFGRDARPRRLSQTRDYAVSRVANIVGKKGDNGRWQFWAQGIATEMIEQERGRPLLRLSPGALDDAGNTVLELFCDRRRASRA